jgi:hypothetical protein
VSPGLLAVSSSPVGSASKAKPKIMIPPPLDSF